MKVNRRLNRFIRKYMYPMELHGQRILLCRRMPFLFFFIAIEISNEHARRYIR